MISSKERPHVKRPEKKCIKPLWATTFPRKWKSALWMKTKRQTLFYEKVSWEIAGEAKGLRYGENPGQEAALYKLANGNLALGDAKTIRPRPNTWPRTLNCFNPESTRAKPT